MHVQIRVTRPQNLQLHEPVFYNNSGTCRQKQAVKIFPWVHRNCRLFSESGLTVVHEMSV